MSSSLPPPILGADPLRPPPADALADDPILAGYGADAGDEPAGEAAGIPVGPAEVTAVLVGVFDGLAQLRGPHWHAEPDEFAMAAPPIARYLSQPDTTVAAWLATHGDALLIVLGMGAVVVPRAFIEYRIIRERAAERELAQQQEPTDGYRPLHPQAYAGAGSDAARAADEPPGGGAGPGLSPARGREGHADGIPSDPRALAASVAGILGA